MNNEYGTIVDLTVTNKASSARYHGFNSIDQAVQIIKELYEKNEVVLGELFTTIAINECNVEDATTIVARARKEIDDYDMVMIMDNECIHLGYPGGEEEYESRRKVSQTAKR